MCDEISSPRRVPQRVSDRKKKTLVKLATDDSMKPFIPDSYDIDLTAPIDSQLDMMEDSPMEGHRDLFGALIPDDKWGCSSTSQTISNKKTETKSKKKQAKDVKSSNSATNPRRNMLPPNVGQIMREAQLELESSMGINKISSGVPALSTGSRDNSGITQLNKSHKIFKGVVAFVDYKIENDQSALDIIDLLNIVGAKVENTFSHKVTHVVFHDGYHNTYRTAKERNIPLVTSQWVVKSHLSNKMMDPEDYKPADVFKYLKPPKKSVYSDTP